MEEPTEPVDSPPEEETPAVADPERVGRFRILGRLGADALGVVYEAEDEASQRTLALEVLWAATPEEGIVGEARAVAALTHPNIDAILDVGEDDGYVYIAMELIEGEPLRARLTGAPLEDAPDIAAQVAEGLAHAHAAGIVHGALTPESVYVTDDGHVKIVDLALAKFRPVDEPSAYMAPEQASGVEVTSASDVFAFGLLYHEMLTGHLPAPDEALDPFVAKCLADDPSARPDGTALVNAFIAPEPPAPPRAPRWRWPVVIVAAVVVLGLLGWLTRREPAVTTYVDLPYPVFHDKQAASEYAAAMRAMRDDSWNLAQVRLAHVVDLEASSAPAHLRLAIATHRTAPGGASAMRAEYTQAINLRAELSDRDRQLADALEPVLLRAPEDVHEAHDRLAKLHDHWPRDLEILDLLASTSGSDPAAQLALADEGVRLDPSDGNAHELRGIALERLDRNDEARKAFEASLAVSVTSTSALHPLEELDSSEGRCQDLERHARLYADRNLSPDPALLEAVFANGTGVEPFHQALTQMVSEIPAPLAHVTETLANAQLAFAHGDFVETRRLASQAEEQLEHDAELSQSPDLHHRGRSLLLGEALAAGDVVEAARFAKDMVADDGPQSVLWVQRLAAGTDPAAVASYEQQRDAQVALLRRDMAPLDAWYLSYASTVFSPADATAALAALPSFGALNKQPLGFRDHMAGRTLFLAGRVDEALPYLRRAVASCSRYRDPWLHADAAVDLGDALASKGDKQGACAAYGKVVSWWAKAKPKSTHADKARAGRATLGCKD